MMLQEEGHLTSTDTIVAEATPPGFGGISVVRVSGPQVCSIMESLFNRALSPRVADYLPFYDMNGVAVDMGIALYFKAPYSFTGEDVLELQGHGGPLVVEMLITRLLQLGARIAQPGEFSERAFLNNKIDLTQAEAILDLIHASSKDAARLAMRSLQGEFAAIINKKASHLSELRVYVEAAIDFSDEEIEFLGLSRIEEKLSQLINDLDALLMNAKQGQRLREGIRLVIVGKPNVGKSSLLNKLCAKDVAIVTPIPGTTRDVIRDHILMDGIPLQIVDTAGLRSSDDVVEQEGIRRAYVEMKEADLILHLIDVTAEDGRDDLTSHLQADLPVITVYNKIDLLDNKKQKDIQMQEHSIQISAKMGTGLLALKQTIKDKMGLKTSTEGLFLARLRHIQALTVARQHMLSAKTLLLSKNAFELIAEELRLAQHHLGEITGTVTSDDLLGNIFKTFCIGK